VESFLPSPAHVTQELNGNLGGEPLPLYELIHGGSKNGHEAGRDQGGADAVVDQTLGGDRSGGGGEHLDTLQENQHSHVIGLFAASVEDLRPTADYEGFVRLSGDDPEIRGEQELGGSTGQDFSGRVSRKGPGSKRMRGEQAERTDSLLITPIPAPPDDRSAAEVASSINSDVVGEANDESPSQWLKSLLPEAASGWWDVYFKGAALAIRFCWRDPAPQRLGFPAINSDHFQSLKQRDLVEVKQELQVRIEQHLRELLLNPDKRAKAMAAAEKLGIVFTSDPALINK